MEKTFIVEIPERLAIGLRRIKNTEDRENVMTALFWAVVCTSENADSKHAGDILHHSFAEQAYQMYIDPCCIDSAEDIELNDDPDRVFAVFEQFSQHIDNYGGWASLYRFFGSKFDFFDYCTRDDVQLDIYVNARQNFMQIEVN